MAAPVLEDILNMTADDIERPKPLPTGSYLCTVVSKEDGVSSKKQTPYTRFFLKPIQAIEDVNEEELEEMGGIGDRTVRTDFYMTKDAAYRLWDFLSDCGVPEKEGKKNLKVEDRIPLAIGASVGVYLTHTPSRDPNSTAVYTNVSRTFAVE